MRDDLYKFKYKLAVKFHFCLLHSITNQGAFKKQQMFSKNERYFFEKKIRVKEAEDERLQKTARKKELEAILQKMIEADAVLLEWSDEL